MLWFLGDTLWKKVFGQTDPTVLPASVSSDFTEHCSFTYFFYKIIVSNRFKNAEFFVQSSDFTVKTAEAQHDVIFFSFEEYCSCTELI